MAIISAGYDGTVDEVQFAGMLPKAGASEYGVDKPGDFKVTITTGAARAVSIAPGTAWGHSVVDVMDTNYTVQFDAATSGTRYDMVVLRRNWQPPGGSTSIEVIKGGTRADVLPTRNNIPGVLDDQPLALVAVRANDANVVSVVDLRCWGRNGGVIAIDDRALQYLDASGTTVVIGKTIWNRKPASSTQGTMVWAKDFLTADHDHSRLFEPSTGEKLRLGGTAADPYLECASVFSRTYNFAPNMYVTSNGIIGRSTVRAATKAELDFAMQDHGHRLLFDPDTGARLILGGSKADPFLECEPVYKRTYSNLAPNVVVTSNGIVGRSTASSSLREYKTNIRPADISPEDVLALEPVIYDRKDGSGENELGLIAQDTEANVPHLTYEEDGKLEGVRYERVAVAQHVVLRHHDGLIAAQAEEIRALKEQLKQVLDQLAK